MENSLADHRRDVKAYLHQSLLNYRHWWRLGAQKKNYLLNRFCDGIHEINSNYEIYFERFKETHQEYLTATYARRGKKDKPTDGHIRKFAWLCSQALVKTLPLMAAAACLESDAAVAAALLNHPKFEAFLRDYAEDFYLDILEDGLL